MSSRGAKNILFLSRSGLDKPTSKELVDQLIGQGVNTQVIKCDVSKVSQLQEALDQASQSMPPIRGCVQGAMVLEVCSRRLSSTGPLSV